MKTLFSVLVDMVIFSIAFLIFSKAREVWARTSRDNKLKNPFKKEK